MTTVTAVADTIHVNTHHSDDSSNNSKNNNNNNNNNNINSKNSDTNNNISTLLTSAADPSPSLDDGTSLTIEIETLLGYLHTVGAAVGLFVLVSVCVSAATTGGQYPDTASARLPIAIVSSALFFTYNIYQTRKQKQQQQQATTLPSLMVVCCMTMISFAAFSITISASLGVRSTTFHMFAAVASYCNYYHYTKDGTLTPSLPARLATTGINVAMLVYLIVRSLALSDSVDGTLTSGHDHLTAWVWLRCLLDVVVSITTPFIIAMTHRRLLNAARRAHTTALALFFDADIIAAMSLLDPKSEERSQPTGRISEDNVSATAVSMIVDKLMGDVSYYRPYLPPDVLRRVKRMLKHNPLGVPKVPTDDSEEDEDDVDSDEEVSSCTPTSSKLDTAMRETSTGSQRSSEVSQTLAILMGVGQRRESESSLNRARGVEGNASPTNSDLPSAAAANTLGAGLTMMGATHMTMMGATSEMNIPPWFKWERLRRPNRSVGSAALIQHHCTVVTFQVHLPEDDHGGADSRRVSVRALIDSPISPISSAEDDALVNPSKDINIIVRAVHDMKGFVHSYRAGCVVAFWHFRTNVPNPVTNALNAALMAKGLCRGRLSIGIDSVSGAVGRIGNSATKMFSELRCPAVATSLGLCRLCEEMSAYVLVTDETVIIDKATQTTYQRDPLNSAVAPEPYYRTRLAGCCADLGKGHPVVGPASGVAFHEARPLCDDVPEMVRVIGLERPDPHHHHHVVGEQMSAPPVDFALPGSLEAALSYDEADSSPIEKPRPTPLTGGFAAASLSEHRMNTWFANFEAAVEAYGKLGQKASSPSNDNGNRSCDGLDHGDTDEHHEAVFDMFRAVCVEHPEDHMARYYMQKVLNRRHVES